MSPRLTLWGVLMLAACTETYVPASTVVRSHATNEKAEAYWSGPWPDDRRLVDGGVATRRFPRPGMGSFISNMLETGDRQLTGWGTTSPMYVPMSQSIDPSTLPPTPGDAANEGASVFVVAVDPSSPVYGVRHPVDFAFLAAPTLYLPGNVLVVRPFPGVPLEPKTTYAVVVTKSVKDLQGASVGPEEELWNVLRGHSTDPYYAPLLAVLPKLNVRSDDVAGAFLFTTQPILDELLVLRDWLEEQPAPPLENLTVKEDRTTFTVFEGTYPAPNMQHGATPFSLEGGAFQYDAGVPIPAQTENLRVAICVPKGPVPSAGFPLVLYSHGTGGDFETVIDDIAADLASVGIASIGIDQVFHGPRGGNNGGCFGQSVELCFFNPVNVVAGRNNSRQAALDNVMLRKMLGAAQVSSSIDPQRRTIHFAAENVGFFGHSQGGLSGAIYAAFDSHLKVAVLSGAGGHLTTTILVRTDPFSVKELAEGPLVLDIAGRESLDAFHPALAFVQALAEVSDPANYGRYYARQPQGAPKHLYLTSGLLDPYTSAFTAEVLAASAGVPQLSPVARLSQSHGIAHVAPVAGPVEGNLESLDGQHSTGVFRQFAGQGHFPVFVDASARAQWKALFDQALHGERVIVQ